MPNLFAYGMIILWPIIAILLYKKFDTVTATFWTIVGGFMFLPVKTAIDLPMIPAIGKDEICGISALIGCVFVKNKSIKFLTVNKTIDIIFPLLLIIPFINVFFNQTPMFDGKYWIQGLTIYDAISASIGQFLHLIPFFIAINIIKTHEQRIKVLKLLAYSGVVYSLFILIEVKLSPQLHTWLYGFMPHSFAQQIRFDGYRPMVFMGHGLIVSIFIFMSFSSAILLHQLKEYKNNIIPVGMVLYLAVVLLLCKSVGSVVFAIFIAFTLFLLGNRLKVVLICFLVSGFFLYPILSILNIFPHSWLVELFSQFDADRAGSLDFRFHQETILIQHIQEQFLIGWGGWGRFRFFDSITDGYWLITLGKYGFIFFILYFLLFIMPIFRTLKFRRTRVNNAEQKLCVGLSLILAVLLIDQLPNASMQGSWIWFIAGCLGINSYREKMI